MIKNFHVRNVNEAFSKLKEEVVMNKNEWREVSPRGMDTIEYKGLWITEYRNPHERVLFDPLRDANPFFHFFEALWILGGRNDVAFLKQFISTIDNFSDDGETFHGAYGHRLRGHFRLPYRKDDSGDEQIGTDQIMRAVEILKTDHASRQVVLGLWDPAKDLGAATKDPPCNDTIFVKVRDGKLNITVCCRSNDAVWGAFGANAVQFSVLQEFMARAIGVEIGFYRQLSDSFHIYTEQDTWLKCKNVNHDVHDRYAFDLVSVYPLINGTEYKEWLAQLDTFLNSGHVTRPNPDSFFFDVASPIMRAWKVYKGSAGSKNERINAASKILQTCRASDWRDAMLMWLNRRRENVKD